MGDKKRRESTDRLSSLPDPILVDILSLLPTKSAAATSALSRRWRHFWTQVHGLSLSQQLLTPSRRSSDDEFRFEDFLTTVDHILRQITSPKIHTFEIALYPPDEHQTQRFGSLFRSWLRQICGRDPNEFTVNQIFYSPPFVAIPASIFHCQSLVSLHLGDWVNYEIRDDDDAISLPNLKKLKLHNIDDSRRPLLARLIKYSPLLEELCLGTSFTEVGDYVDLGCRILRVLTIKTTVFSRPAKYMIDAPMLENLVFHSVFSSNSFVANPSGLREADIRLYFGPKSSGHELEDEARWVWELLGAVSSVRSLCLYGLKFFDPVALSGYGGIGGENRRTLWNLTELSIEEIPTRFFRVLLDLLNRCPGLEALSVSLVVVDEGPMELDRSWVGRDSTTTTPAWLTRVRSVELVNPVGCRDEHRLIRYILGRGEVLERLRVVVDIEGPDASSREAKFCRKLFRYPRRSSGCEVLFSGDHLSVSSNELTNGFLDRETRCPPRIKKRKGKGNPSS